MLSKITSAASLLFFSFLVSGICHCQTPNKKINIRVIDAVTSKPVVNADINLKGLIFKQKRKTDSEGKASFDVYLISSELVLSFEVIDTSSSRTHKTYKTTLTLTANRDNYDMNVSMEPNSKMISIKLADNNGNPLANARLKLSGAGGNQLSSTTDANGVGSFEIPPTDAYKNASLSVEKDGYEKYNVNLNIDDQTGQYSVIAPLKKETVIAMKKEATPIVVENNESVNSGMLGPTKNVGVTSVDANAISIKGEGPYTPQCSGNPVSAIPSFPSWALPPEKGFSDFISDACISSAGAAVDALTDLMMGIDTISTALNKLSAEFEKIQRESLRFDIPESEKTKFKNELIKFGNKGKQAYDKSKAIFSALASFAAGPEMYAGSCFLSGLKKYVESLGGTDLEAMKKVKKGFDDIEATRKDLGNRLDNIDMRSKDQDIDYIKDLRSVDWKTGYNRLSETKSALNVLISFVTDPKKFLSYETQANLALSNVEGMLGGLVMNCKLRDCDNQLKDGISAGQKALIAARRHEAEMRHMETIWSDKINDWVSKNTKEGDDLRRWPYLASDNIKLMVIHDQYDNWVKFHNERIEAEEKDSSLTRLLKKLGEQCSKLQPIAATLNQRVNAYLDLFSKGSGAIESCDFKKAESIIGDLKKIETGECKSFFPVENGLALSAVLENKEKNWKVYAKCDKEVIPKGVTKYGPFEITSKGWQSTTIQLKKGECFDVKATGVMYSRKDSTSLHFGPDGGGYWVWWTLKAKIGEQRVTIGSKGGGCANDDGLLEFGTPTVNGFQQDAEDDLAGSFMVTVYVTHH